MTGGGLSARSRGRMKSMFPALLTLLLTTLSSLAEESIDGRTDLLTGSKRVVFLGDSITWDGTYTANFATWAQVTHPDSKSEWFNLGLSSETVSGLSEKNHAGGRFPRPDLHERLERVLEQTRPDLVFACYGMNCGIYQEFDEERFGQYQEGIRWLKRKVEDTGARLILLTPPHYDAVRKPKKGFYTEVLETYSQWLLDQQKDGWHVIDLNGAMRSFLEEARKEDPEFTLQPDGIHPRKQGHWVMAQAMIGWFGDRKVANDASEEKMLERSSLPAGIGTLTKQRMTLLRDAWLTTTGHVRPGLPKGKPLPEARQLAAELDKKIEALIHP